jgi:hypothetical protein
MNTTDYWAECISDAAEECGLDMTAEQLSSIAASVQAGHENYGMAFYSPPPSDRLSDIDRRWQQRFDALQSEFDAYRGNAEKAVGKALRQFSDASISIGEDGEVFRHGGRTERLQ